jgi:hypothetical protein
VNNSGNIVYLSAIVRQYDLRYVEITQKDLQCEFQQARQNPRHLLPLSATVAAVDTTAADAAVVMDRLSGAIRVLDLFRQQTAADDSDKTLPLLLRRLARVRSLFEKFSAPVSSEK